MKKLDKLNITLGSILPPSTSGAPIQPFTLPITLFSLHEVSIPSPIDPSSLPLVRSLHLTRQTCQTIRLLLPQLASLRVGYVNLIADFNLSIQDSTSITSLALDEQLIVHLDDASKTVIKEQIVEFGLIISMFNNSNSILTAIIAGSKVMKKVILDGVNLGVEDQSRYQVRGPIQIVKEACKKKGIDLWKENFEVGNGKVDLEK
jgi:hypothetical protein